MKKRACNKEEKNIQEELVEMVEEMVEDVQPIDEEQPIEDVVEDVQDEEVIEEVVDENRADEIQPVQDEEPIDNIEEEQPIDNVEEEIEERIIEGYAIVFNELSEDLGGFREMILPEAVNEELINNANQE